MMGRMKSFSWLPLCLAACAGAETRPDGSFECRRASGPIVIDGRADEAAWARAQRVDGFTLHWLGEKARPARTATRARLLWDDEALYFFAEMDDADLFARVKERDGMTWLDDVFELFFKPHADRPGYYEFQVNPLNTQLDMYLPERGKDGGYAVRKSDREFDYRSAVVLRGTLNKKDDQDQGWSCEGRIAWSGFAPTGGAPAPGAVWAFALCRYDYSRDFPKGPELSSSAPLTQPSFHRHEDYAPLRFVR